ncbi:hypothetical protein [Paenibacillus sp. FSL R10-2734]|uniref:hypothetical protein n=1 Tax=Paenibacillus sp. FSL R10-2734 TaxID=2954691 RepID=UPI0030DA0902
MKTIIIVQMALLFFIFTFTFLLYRAKTWKASTIFNKAEAISITFQLALVVWAFLSLVTGIFYFFLTTKSELSGFILSVILIPLIILFYFGIKVLVNSNNTKKSIYEINTKSNEVILWSKSFPFLSKDQIDLNVYLSKGKAVGRVTVHGVNEHEANLIKMKKSGLPADIFLNVIMENDENCNLYKH